MKFLITIILVLDLLAIYRVLKDETYLFDKEKGKYIFWIILIPVIGAIVAMRKIGYKWLVFLSEPSNLSSSDPYGIEDKTEFTYYVGTHGEGVDIGGGDGGF